MKELKYYTLPKEVYDYYVRTQVWDGRYYPLTARIYNGYALTIYVKP